MSEKYDAVIIGADIIGVAITYERSKQGNKTLNLDMLPAAGYSSTSNSCTIITVSATGRTLGEFCCRQ